MAIDKNTTQINNFSKGMNTDTSDAYLEDGSYRMAVNLRYTTSVGSNSGELHMIEGCTNLIEGNGHVVKKATQLRDIGVIVTEDDAGWYVYTINGGSRTRIATITDKSRVWHKKISTVCRYEDSDNQKLYIADGAGPIIVVQLTDQNQKNLNKMLAYPSALLDVPKFSGLITGSLKSGAYQYAYQLYAKHASTSEISVATKMIPLHKGDPSYTDATQSEGYEKDVQTDKGIKITIDVNNKLRETFDSIYIYRIHYKEVGQVPDIDLVYDDKLPEGTLNFSDTGVKSISVLSLEEYNSITGIHIIPSVIEAKDDYLFAANIKNDAPIYKDTAIKNWDASTNVTYRFTCAELTGDTGEDAGCIQINKTGFSDVLNQFGQDRFVGEVNDENKTYANAYAQYSFKSLRRGETYRYGIILYDQDGNASAVKYIDDIEVDGWKENVPFRQENGELIVRPIGIEFTVSNLPSTVAKYEIVRCGRDYQDIRTMSQCVLSRPVQRLFEQVFEDDHPDYDRAQSKCPLTPTGLVTTQDYISYVYANNHMPPFRDGVQNAWEQEYTNTASNIDIVNRDNRWNITGNKDIFQIISPEYNYQSESLKEMFSNVELEIEPLGYIYPTKTELGNITWHGDEVGGDGANSSWSADYYKIGNSYAHFPVENNLITIDSRGGTMLSYYYRDDSDVFNNHTLEVTNDDVTSQFLSDGDRNSRYGYIKLYNNIDLPDTFEISKVKSIGFPNTLDWDDFATPSETYQLTYTDKVCAVGGTNFVNWVSNGIYGMEGLNESIDDEDSAFYPYKLNQTHLDDSGSLVGAMMGPGGRCIVAKLDTQQFANNHGIVNDNYFGTYICNIKKKSTPYGGDSKVAIENSTYRSFGDLFDASQTTCNVFDGDCYIIPFEYVSQHKWYHPYLPSARNACIVYSIPMETNINIPYTCGYEFSKHIGDTAISNIQDQPSNVNNIFIQDKPLYAYDTINNTVPTAKTLIPQIDEEDAYDTNMDYRVFHSDKKSNNERTDSWLMYRAADYIDVDNRYGAITGLRKFNNSLVFWQEVAAGILQVNERAQITDDSNLPLILGTGGVLGRYDYINTKNGMKEGEFADTQSDNMLYWWDHDKKQILSYTSGVMAQELSKIKFVQSFFSNCNDVDDPILFFDKQNNEAVFKVSTEGSIVFNENTGCFTGLYTINPSGAIVLPDSLLLLSNNASIKTWNSIEDDKVKDLNGGQMLPTLKYVVNSNALMTKTFDNVEFGGRVYGGGSVRTHENNNPLKHITFDFYTPLKQHGKITGDKIDNTEYNFRFAVPRADDAIYGGRLRGKTMEAVMQSDSNSYDFSLQFILTKFRISWA